MAEESLETGSPALQAVGREVYEWRERIQASPFPSGGSRFQSGGPLCPLLACLFPGENKTGLFHKQTGLQELFTQK